MADSRAPVWGESLAALRSQIFARLATTGAAPSAAEAAAELGLTSERVLSGWRDLHALHQIVLGPELDAVRMAHPFSAAPMGFVLRADDDRLWWGGCAWDSFGIVAALGEELEIETRCPGCRRTLRFRCGPGLAPPELTVRLPRPAREWWDDVVATCSDIRLCCDEQHARDYVAQAGLPPGELVEAERMWRLAQPWYGDRLDPDYAPQSPEQRRRQLVDAGLTGPFWDLPACEA